MFVLLYMLCYCFCAAGGRYVAVAMRLPTQPVYTTQLQKYKTKTRRVYHCPVFSLKIASLSFVIITMLNILKSPNP